MARCSFSIGPRHGPLSGRLAPARAGRAGGHVAARVARARERQQARFARGRIHCNAQMDGRQVRRHVPLDAPSRALLEEVATHHGLSGRALHRTCKVARTLADLDGSEEVTDEHLMLALTLQRARFDYQH